MPSRVRVGRLTLSVPCRCHFPLFGPHFCWIASAGTRWCKRSWHPIEIAVPTEFNHHPHKYKCICLSQRCLWLQRGILQTGPNKIRGAQFLLLFARNLLRCSSSRGSVFLTLIATLTASLHVLHSLAEDCSSFFNLSYAFAGARRDHEAFSAYMIVLRRQNVSNGQGFESSFFDILVNFDSCFT